MEASDKKKRDNEDKEANTGIFKKNKENRNGNNEKIRKKDKNCKKVKIAIDKNLKTHIGDKDKLTVKYETEDKEKMTAKTGYGRFRVLEEEKIDTVRKYRKGRIICTQEAYILVLKRCILPVLLVLFLLAAIIAAMLLKGCANKEDENTGVIRGIPVRDEVIIGDGVIEIGEISWERYDFGDDEGAQLSFSVNVSPVINASTGAGDILIVNPEVNDYSIVAEIYLYDNPDTIIYRSPILPPGSSIQEGTPDRIPSSGEHKAICFLNAVENEENLQVLGTVGVEMIIIVK